MSWRSSLVQWHHLPNWPQWRWVGGPMLVWSNIISYLFWYSVQFFERQYHAFGSQLMQVHHWPISDWFLLSSLLSSSHIGDGVDGVPPKVNQVSSWEEGLAQPMIYHQYYSLLKIWTFMLFLFQGHHPKPEDKRNGFCGKDLRPIDWQDLPLARAPP